MKRFMVAAVLVAGAVLVASPAGAQDTKESETFVVDKSLAKAGKNVWSAKGCMGCHMIGKKLAAPDLNGLYERRTAEWVKT